MKFSFLFPAKEKLEIVNINGETAHFANPARAESKLEIIKQ